MPRPANTKNLFSQNVVHVKWNRCGKPEAIDKETGEVLPDVYLKAFRLTPGEPITVELAVGNHENGWQEMEARLEMVEIKTLKGSR